MPRLVIIAGPQSSGKTTVFHFLRNYLGDDRPLDKKIVFLPEINPYCLAGKNHLGAAFVDNKLQTAIADADFTRMKKIAEERSQCSHNDRIKNIDVSTTYCIETGIFGLVYIEHILGRREANMYFEKYLQVYRSLSPVVLFIDTKPHISWKRRKYKYLERIKNTGITNSKEKKDMLKKYRNNICALYPLWLKWYKKFPFEKYMIRNSHKAKKIFLKQVLTYCKKLLDRKV